MNKKFIKKLNAELKIISDSRDELRRLSEEINSQLEAIDKGIEALESAIDYLSEYN